MTKHTSDPFQDGTLQSRTATDGGPSAPAIPDHPPAPATAGQPHMGLLGLPIVAAGFIILGILPGGPQSALETAGPIATFALPVLAASALWWQGWPFNRQRQPLAGPVELWVTVSCLNFIAATAIAHVAVFHRWPIGPHESTG